MVRSQKNIKKQAQGKLVGKCVISREFPKTSVLGKRSDVYG